MIENPESVRSYVSDLVEISGMTSSAVAGKAGVFRGNLQKWLRGQGQSLGPPGISKVLSVLNVESGHLSSVVVHFLKSKIPLRFSASFSGKGEAFSGWSPSPPRSPPRETS